MESLNVGDLLIYVVESKNYKAVHFHLITKVDTKNNTIVFLEIYKSTKTSVKVINRCLNLYRNTMQYSLNFHHKSTNK